MDQETKDRFMEMDMEIVHLKKENQELKNQIRSLKKEFKRLEEILIGGK